MNLSNLRKYSDRLSISNKVFFYFPMLIILIPLYRNSILPGNKILITYDIYLLFTFMSLYLLVIFDFNKFLSTKVILLNGTSKFITLLYITFFISTFVFNIHEVYKSFNLVRLLLFIQYFLIYFWILPKFILIHADYFLKLVTIIVFFSFITAAIGFMMLILNIDANKPGQLVSFIGHPNDVAVIFIIGIISTIFYIDWRKKKLSKEKKTILYGVVFFQLIALLLTYTRAGYIGLGVGLIFYYFLKYRQKFLYLFPIFILLIIIVIPPFFTAKGFGSFTSRLFLLIPAFNMMTNDLSALIWGYGATNAFAEFLKFNMFNIAGEEHLNNPHNIVASLILMFGLIFTVIILIYISLLLIRFSLKSIKSTNLINKSVYSFLVSILLAYIFLSLFDSSVVMPEFYNMQIFLIFLGILNHLTKPELKEYNFMN